MGHELQKSDRKIELIPLIFILGTRWGYIQNKKQKRIYCNFGCEETVVTE